MKLADYLASRDLPAMRFAAEIGVQPSTITRILRGERRPSLGTLRRIMQATDNLVGPDDFADLPANEAA